MKIVNSINQLRQLIRSIKQEGRTIGLVPTMGYLHEGHLSLMRQARKDCDVVIVSIFVNPTQFGAGEDYESYPRDLRRDAVLAEKEKVNYVFAPDVKEMYPSGYATYVEVKGLSETMCGKSRPTHFRGVTTVVAKLLNLVQPDIAYFGQKDAQQAVIIKKMVSDLNMNVEVKVLPTVREKDGLAMSSRNKYLNSDERKAATILYRALLEAKEETERGEQNASLIKKKVSERIATEKLARLDYIEIADPESLNGKTAIDGPALIAVAAWVGKTRLIDNIIVNPKP